MTDTRTMNSLPQQGLIGMETITHGGGLEHEDGESASIHLMSCPLPCFLLFPVLLSLHLHTFFHLQTNKCPISLEIVPVSCDHEHVCMSCYPRDCTCISCDHEHVCMSC